MMRASSMEAFAAARTRTPADDIELDQMFRRAYHDHNIAVIRIDDIHDDFTKQTIVNLATKLFGKRIRK